MIAMPSSGRRTALRRIARVVAMLLAFGVAIVAVLLLHAHVQIRGIDPELPSLEAVRAQADFAELPIRVSTWNTASQVTPRKQVLEASLDPDPQAPYVMSHAVFLLEWADGRALLVDAGMDREQAAVVRASDRVGGRRAGRAARGDRRAPRSGARRAPAGDRLHARAHRSRRWRRRRCVARCRRTRACGSSRRPRRWIW